jgi:acyl-CoA-binding protein
MRPDAKRASCATGTLDFLAQSPQPGTVDLAGRRKYGHAFQRAGQWQSDFAADLADDLAPMDFVGLLAGGIGNRIVHDRKSRGHRHGDRPGFVPLDGAGWKFIVRR